MPGFAEFIHIRYCQMSLYDNRFKASFLMGIIYFVFSIFRTFKRSKLSMRCLGEAKEVGNTMFSRENF